MQKAGIKIVKRKTLRKWHFMNWNLPNIILAEIWIPEVKKATTRISLARTFWKKRRAKYDARSAKKIPADLIEKERQAAELWKSRQL